MYFLVTVCINFCLAYMPEAEGDHIETTAFITAHRTIACKYARSWFLWDLLAALPYLAAEQLFPSSSESVQSVLRLLPLIQIGRLRYFGQFVVEIELLFGTSPGASRLWKSVIYILTVIHVGTCIWYALGRHSDTLGMPDSWLSGVSGIPENSPASLYMISAYYVATTLTTVRCSLIALITHGNNKNRNHNHPEWFSRWATAM